MSLRFHALSLSFVAALCFAACGDDDDDDGGGDAGSGNEAGAPTSGGSGSSEAGSPGQAGSGSSTAGSGSGGAPSGGGAPGGGGSDGAGGAPATSFFVTSDSNPTGNLGGLEGADARCQALADAAGHEGTFQAYLSVEVDAANDDMPTNARDRIGTGPWYNALGELVASDVEELHSISGSAALFVDENGERINGQWEGSPTPNEHDILTGSTAEGEVMLDMTCEDWTSESADIAAQVGHSDGLGPNMDDTPPLNSWNSAHASESCADTAPRGGAGKIYCFAID